VSKIYPPIEQHMANMEFISSSPTLMNANTKESNGTLSSCFPMDIEDSIEGIFEALKESALVTKMGGGVGHNYSRLRGSSEIVKGINRPSSGPVAFIENFNCMLHTIMQGGRRRGAGMAILNVFHPDILQFVRAKRDLGKFQRLNFSVEMPSVFYKKLEKEPDSIHQVRSVACDIWYNLTDNGKPVTVKQLWDEIIEHGWKTGEPGIFNVDIAKSQCTVTNLSEMVLSNPCQEFVNIPYASCNLGSINLSLLVDGKKFDWERYEDLIIKGTRFLNHVIDVNNYPIKKIKDVTLKIRPIGLGLMGLAHALFKKGLAYNSDKAIKFTEEVVRYATLRAMKESVELSKIHGQYPAFDYDLFMNANARFFTRATCKNIDVEQLKKDIKKHGVHNSCFTSIAPTGTISTIAETSSGIEPVFALSYMRKVEQKDQTYDVMYITDPVFLKYLQDNFNEDQIKKILTDVSESKGSCQNIKLIPEEMRKVFITAGDLTPIEHLDILEVAAVNTSLSVSKTINLPSNIKKEEIANVFLEAHKRGIIGVTVYRDGCREGVLVHKEDEQSITYIVAPERPKSLPCHVYKMTVSGEKWIVFVGMYEGKPFEVFAGKINLVDIPSNISDGVITKIGSMEYQFEYNGEVLIKDITKIFENETHEALTRMISIALQHGTEIKKIIGQLQKSKGTIVDFSKSILRALKKYLKDGDLSGSKCPNCGEPLIFIGGCLECPAKCGYSACG